MRLHFHLLNTQILKSDNILIFMERAEEAIAYIFERQFPWWLRWNGICLQYRRSGLDLCVRKTLWRRECNPL